MTPVSPALRALQLPAGPTFATALRDAWDRGDAVLPLPANLPAGPRDRLLARLRPASLADAAGFHRLDDAQPVPSGTALVVMTSGSIAGAKAVELPYTALQASARATAARLRLTRANRWLCCLPLDHIAGLQVLLRSWLLGGEAIVQPRFEVSAVAAAADQAGAAGAATIVSLVPTMLARLLDAGADLTGFRWILLGGAPAPASLLDRARAAGARVVVTYGMTETCGGCVYDGRPLEGVEVATGDDGRIRLRGPVLFSGYRGDPDATSAALDDGWLRTGDLGHLASDGRLEVLGRADDVILTGGENVRPSEVAALLAEHPGIAEVEIVGVPDAEWGQRVVAIVVPNGDPISLDDLRNFLADRAPRHWSPRQVVLLDTLPRLDTGKMDRAALRAAAASPSAGS